MREVSNDIIQFVLNDSPIDFQLNALAPAGEEEIDFRITEDGRGRLAEDERLRILE